MTEYDLFMFVKGYMIKYSHVKFSAIHNEKADGANSQRLLVIFIAER